MVDSGQTFRVRIGDGCNQYDEVSVIIETPTTRQCFLPIISPTPGGFIVRYTLRETGTYTIRVLLNSCHVLGSPFRTEVLPIPIFPTAYEQELQLQEQEQLMLSGYDESRRTEGRKTVSNTNFNYHNYYQRQHALLVRAYGPGLREIGLLNHIAEFIVDLKPVVTTTEDDDHYYYLHQHQHELVKVVVEGPCETKIHCKDNHDGTCSVAFLPAQIGLYRVTVLYNSYHIQASPFTIQIIDQQEQQTDGLMLLSHQRPTIKIKPTASFRKR